MVMCKVCGVRIENPRGNQTSCDGCYQRTTNQGSLTSPTVGEVLASVIATKVTGWALNELMKRVGLREQAAAIKKVMDGAADEIIRGYNEAKKAERPNDAKPTDQQPGRVMDKVSKAYWVLGLQSGASLEEANQQLKRLAALWHPDVNKDPQATIKFAEFSAAYATLKKHLEPN